MTLTWPFITKNPAWLTRKVPPHQHPSHEVHHRDRVGWTVGAFEYSCDDFRGDFRPRSAGPPAASSSSGLSRG